MALAETGRLKAAACLCAGSPSFTILFFFPLPSIFTRLLSCCFFSSLLFSFSSFLLLTVIYKTTTITTATIYWYIRGTTVVVGISQEFAALCAVAVAFGLLALCYIREIWGTKKGGLRASRRKTHPLANAFISAVS